MKIEVKSVIGIITIIDGIVNILTKNNKLIIIDCDNDIDYINSTYIKNKINNDIHLKQCYTFCNKENDKLVVSIIYLDIVNINNFKLSNQDYKFIPINNFKNKYTDKILEQIKQELVLFSTIKKLYPSEFVLPELQKLYENILNTKYDRRNFRKKFLRLGIIEELDKYTENRCGRPAKLYKFKDLKEDKVLL